MGRPLPYWREMFDHAQLDEWWEPQRYQNKFDRVRVPVLHISGWYDDEQIGTPLNFAGMVAHARDGRRAPVAETLHGPVAAQRQRPADQARRGRLRALRPRSTCPRRFCGGTTTGSKGSTPDS